MIWQDLAACAEVDGDLFFPSEATPSSLARALCRACPVTVECLSAAIEADEQFGIWGGLNVSQRRQLRKGLSA